MTRHQKVCCLIFTVIFLTALAQDLASSRAIPGQNKPDRLASFRMTDEVPPFEYEPPFTPTRPRKKRKNKNTQERRNLPEALERTRQELLVGGWVHDCTSPLVVIRPKSPFIA